MTKDEIRDQLVPLHDRLAQMGTPRLQELELVLEDLTADPEYSSPYAPGGSGRPRKPAPEV